MIENLFSLIVILVEVAIALVVLDAILYILKDMFSISWSWKKLLLSVAAILGILWLRNRWRKNHDDEDGNVMEGSA